MTKEELLNYWKKYKKKFEKHNIGGSLTKPLFIGDKFNPDNWNGGDFIRIYLCDLFDKYDIRKDEKFSLVWNDDTWKGKIKLKDGIVNIEWYKSRGRTDMIKFKKKPITLEQYLDAINELNLDNFIKREVEG